MAFDDTAERTILRNSPVIGKALLGADCKKGDALGVSSNEFVPALATVGTAIPAVCYAMQDGKDGESIFVTEEILVEGPTGAAVGGVVYLGEGTDAGACTQSAPATNGDLVQILGIALSATQLLLRTPSAATTVSG